jgi:hypothetical protein
MHTEGIADAVTAIATAATGRARAGFGGAEAVTVTGATEVCKRLSITAA